MTPYLQQPQHREVCQTWRAKKKNTFERIDTQTVVEIYDMTFIHMSIIQADVMITDLTLVLHESITHKTFSWFHNLSHIAGFILKIQCISEGSTWV